MPRASVGVGPMRVGSGCCVALVVPILIVGLLVGVFVGLSNAATPSARNARRATFREIKNNYPYGVREGAYHIIIFENEIKCNKLTSTRYHCTFTFTEEGCAGLKITRGSSTVSFYRYGTEVDLHVNNAPCTR